MSYGLQIANAYGDIVIDDRYQNHIKVESGVGSSGVTIMFATAYPFSRQPMLWTRCTTGYVGFQSWVLNGSGDVIGAVLVAANYSGGSYSSLIAGSISYNWILTAHPAAPAGGDFGLRVYTPAGAVCFDSNYDYIRIKDIIKFTVGNIYNPVSHASVANAYYCVSALFAIGCAQISGIHSLV